jgi:5'-deoxynucleotidase YfbR-like HD superfamily hydrolase
MAPLPSFTSLHSQEILKFLYLIGKSKRILRSGWVREKVRDPESVAEHSFRLSVMAMVFADQLGLDKERLIKMALVHDLAEIITGDLVWSRGAIIDIKKRAEKEEREKREIEKIFAMIGQQDEYRKLYSDMTERVSSEARIFWQLDKLEMAIQAFEYEVEQGKKLDEFFVNADLQISHPLLRKIFNRILRSRKK